MTRFEIGDIVCLTTGSEPMKVVAVFGTRLVECEWTGKEGRKYKNHFRPDSLDKCDERDQKKNNIKNSSFKKVI